MPFGLMPHRRTDDVFTEMRREVDRLFDRFFYPEAAAPSVARAARWSPELDLVESDKEYLVCCELPGLDEKEVQIALSGNVLTIRGEKKWTHEEKGRSYLLSERRFGAFERMLTLPADVDIDKIKASYANGVLELTLPKSSRSLPRQIPVEPRRPAIEGRAK